MTLKINSSMEGNTVVFGVSGRIRQDQLELLEFLFVQTAEVSDIVLELRDVKLVDREAVRFLAKYESQGVLLRNCPAYIREWISRENSNQ